VSAVACVIFFFIQIFSICQTLIQTVQVANHLHGLIFELKERMDSRQDQPVLHFFFIIYIKKNVIFLKV
jgi:hypothetical protein